MKSILFLGTCLLMITCNQKKTSNTTSIDSNPEEAVKLMNSVVEANTGTQDLKDLKDLLSELHSK